MTSRAAWARGVPLRAVLFGLVLLAASSALVPAAEAWTIRTILPVDGVGVPLPGPVGVNPCGEGVVAGYHVRAWVWQPYWNSYWYESAIHATVRTFDTPGCAPEVLGAWGGCWSRSSFVTTTGCVATSQSGILDAAWDVDGEFRRCPGGSFCETDRLSAWLTVSWSGGIQCGSAWSIVPQQPNNPMSPRMERQCWKD